MYILMSTIIFIYLHILIFLHILVVFAYFIILININIYIYNNVFIYNFYDDEINFNSIYGISIVLIYDKCYKK